MGEVLIERIDKESVTAGAEWGLSSQLCVTKCN